MNLKQIGLTALVVVVILIVTKAIDEKRATAATPKKMIFNPNI